MPEAIIDRQHTLVTKEGSTEKQLPSHQTRTGGPDANVVGPSRARRREAGELAANLSLDPVSPTVDQPETLQVRAPISWAKKDITAASSTAQARVGKQDLHPRLYKACEEGTQQSQQQVPAAYLRPLRLQGYRGVKLIASFAFESQLCIPVPHAWVHMTIYTVRRSEASSSNKCINQPMLSFWKLCQSMLSLLMLSHILPPRR